MTQQDFTRFRRLALAALASTSFLGCAIRFYPPTPLPEPRRDRLVVHPEFRVGVLRFGYDGDRDVARDAALVAAQRSVPAVLLEELARGERFSVFEGNNLGEDENAFTAENAHRFVDAYISGTILAESRNDLCFEARLTNAHTHEVLFVSSLCVPDRSSGTGSSPAPGPIRGFAHRLEDAVPMIDKANVIAAEDRLLTLDVGHDRQVQRGMVGFLTATGGVVIDPTAEEAVEELTGKLPQFTTDLTVVGEFYVIDVSSEKSVAYLYSGDYARLGDTAFFK